jgi:hypothetical protein
MCRVIPLLLALALASACTLAPTPEALEAANRNELQRLVQISLTERLRPQIAGSYRQQVTALLPAEPPPSAAATRLVDEEIEAVLDQKLADLDDRLGAIFASRFTPDEIRQLLAFHESEVGRKSLAASAAMAGESSVAIQEWSQGFEQALFERLTARFGAEGIEF